jgi:hypothetical protein
MCVSLTVVIAIPLQSYFLVSKDAAYREADAGTKRLVDGDAEDLAVGCCSVVRDVEVAVRPECHTGRKEESGGYIFDIAGAIQAYNLASARGWDSRVYSAQNTDGARCCSRCCQTLTAMILVSRNRGPSIIGSRYF